MSEVKVELLPGEQPWECAKRLDKSVIAPIMGCMVGVYYPFRKSADLYIADKGKWHCCQCDQDIKSPDLPAHIERHGKQHKNHKRLSAKRTGWRPPKETDGLPAFGD